MQIDVLVKNERHVKIQKNIGRIFRQYNVVEYKSPEDDLNIDDFYKEMCIRDRNGTGTKAITSPSQHPLLMTRNLYMEEIFSRVSRMW